MAKRRIYEPKKPGDIRRRTEWVELADGDICVWSLTAAEAAETAERSARPKIDPRGGLDPGAAAAWEIVIAAHRGEPTDEEHGRVFTDIGQVLCLPYEEFSLLMQASNRVNGKDPTEVEIRKAFTEATGAHSTSDSSSSASSTSGGSPVKSTARSRT